MTTEQVLERHLTAFLAGDNEMNMADYADDCALITADGTFHGKEAVAEFFDGLFSSLFKAGTYVQTLTCKEVVGEIAYITWHSTGEACDVPIATDTFLVRDGKIQVQTFAGTINPK